MTCWRLSPITEGDPLGRGQEYVTARADLNLRIIEFAQRLERHESAKRDLEAVAPDVFSAAHEATADQLRRMRVELAREELQLRHDVNSLLELRRRERTIAANGLRDRLDEQVAILQRDLENVFGYSFSQTGPAPVASIVTFAHQNPRIFKMRQLLEDMEQDLERDILRANCEDIFRLEGELAESRKRALALA